MLISLLAVLVGLVPPSPASRPVVGRITDAQIFGTLSILDAAMIEAAKLGASKGSSQEVRDYAGMLLSTHQLSKRQGDSLAARLGVTPALSSDKNTARDHIRAMERLKGQTGATFDWLFMSAMADDHESCMARVDKLAKKATNAELKAFILKMQPDLARQMQVGRDWLNSHTRSD